MSTLLGVYWGARKQDLESCAEHCHQALQLLAVAGFGQFYRVGASRKDASKAVVSVSVAAVRAELSRGQNKKDIGGSAIPELGFRLSLWSGHKSGESYKVTALCGAYSERVSNTFLLQLPVGGPHSFAEKEPEVRNLFQQLVTLWSPREAVICDSNQIEWSGNYLSPSVQSREHYRAAQG